MSSRVHIGESQSYGKSNLSTQKLSHKRLTLEVRQEVESFKNSAGKFCCTQCNKSYIHFKHLKRHNRKHTGYRPHVCPLCRDSFCRSDIMKRHYDRCYNKLTTTGKCSTVSRVPKKPDPNQELDRQQQISSQNNQHMNQNNQQLQASQLENHADYIEIERINLDHSLATTVGLSDSPKMISSYCTSYATSLNYPPISFSESETIPNSVYSLYSFSNMGFPNVVTRIPNKCFDYTERLEMNSHPIAQSQQQSFQEYSEDIRITDYDESTCSSYSNSSSDNCLSATSDNSQVMSVGVPIASISSTHNSEQHQFNKNISNSANFYEVNDVSERNSVDLTTISRSSW